MNDNSDALRQAAKIVGRPLLQHEIDVVNKACAAALSRETLQARFLNVRRGAGYTSEGVAEKICAEHLDEYMKNVPAFVKMLLSYELNDYDPE